MAQNSSGKRGNAPQVAVVIGVVLILIGEPFPASLGGLLLSAIPFAIGWGCSKKQA